MKQTRTSILFPPSEADPEVHIFKNLACCQQTQSYTGQK